MSGDTNNQDKKLQIIHTRIPNDFIQNAGKLGLNIYERIVFQYIHSRDGRTNSIYSESTSWPSIDKMVDDLAICKTTIKKTLKTLKNKELISWKLIYHGNNSQKSNEYKAISFIDAFNVLVGSRDDLAKLPKVARRPQVRSRDDLRTGRETTPNKNKGNKNNRSNNEKPTDKIVRHSETHGQNCPMVESPTTNNFESHLKEVVKVYSKASKLGSATYCPSIYSKLIKLVETNGKLNLGEVEATALYVADTMKISFLDPDTFFSINFYPKTSVKAVQLGYLKKTVKPKSHYVYFEPHPLLEDKKNNDNKKIDQPHDFDKMLQSIVDSSKRPTNEKKI